MVQAGRGRPAVCLAVGAWRVQEGAEGGAPLASVLRENGLCKYTLGDSLLLVNGECRRGQRVQRAWHLLCTRMACTSMRWRFLVVGERRVQEGAEGAARLATALCKNGLCNPFPRFYKQEDDQAAPVAPLNKVKVQGVKNMRGGCSSVCTGSTLGLGNERTCTKL
eukprot:1151905-Pelagomonas_calceolata.AAC.2